MVTDHNPLVHLQTQRDLSRRQARWAEFLQRFTFKWHYRPGRTNVADAISRMPHLDASREGYAAAVTRARAQGPARSPAADASMPDAGSAGVQSAGVQGAGTPAAGAEAEVQVPPVRPQAVGRTPDHVLGLMDRLKAGYAYDSWFECANNTARLMPHAGLWWHEGCAVVPDCDGLRAELVFHDSPFAGHVGAARTAARLGQHYWWYGMGTEVSKYVQACAQCQRSKSVGKRPAGLLQPLQIPGKFWHSVSMDLITALLKTAAGHDAIVVFVDRLSKMTHLQACCGTLDSAGLIDLLIRNVVRLHGVPQEVIFDRDVRLASSLSREFFSRMGIPQRLSTAFHPQSDGQTERMNRVLEMLRSNVSPRLDDWDQHLSMCEFAINSAHSASVKSSPFELVYGENPRIPAIIEHGPVPEAMQATGKNAAEVMIARVAGAVKHARRCMAEAQQRQKAAADAHRRDLHFEVGDQVLLST